MGNGKLSFSHHCLWHIVDCWFDVHAHILSFIGEPWIFMLIFYNFFLFYISKVLYFYNYTVHLRMPGGWVFIVQICQCQSVRDRCSGKYTVIYWNENGPSAFVPQSIEILCKCYLGFVSAVRKWFGKSWLIEKYFDLRHFSRNCYSAKLFSSDPLPILYENLVVKRKKRGTILWPVKI